MKHLKWAVVGPGEIAESFIGDMALVYPGFHTVAGVMSPQKEEAATFAKKHGVAHYEDDLNRMLEKARPDIVYIADPHPEHFDSAMECLRQGCAVLCEKPLAMNVDQVNALIRESQKRRLFLMEGMWIRFLPSIKKVLEIIEEGIVGAVKGVVADMSYVAPKEGQNRFYDPEKGGGSLLDLGIYPVYLALLVMGIPLKISASAQLSKKGIDESCKAGFDYGGNRFALLNSSIIENTGNSACIIGEKGQLKILNQWNEKPKGIEVTLLNANRLYFPCEWEGRGFQFEIKEVSGCLEDNKIESSLHRHADSLKLAKTLDLIRQQAGIQYEEDVVSET